MTNAPNSRASCVTIVPTAPAAPCTSTLCPARRRPWSNSPCHAVSPEIGRLAPAVKSTSPGSGARLRASTATYSARLRRCGELETGRSRASSAARWPRSEDDATVQRVGPRLAWRAGPDPRLRAEALDYVTETDVFLQLPRHTDLDRGAR